MTLSINLQELFIPILNVTLFTTLLRNFIMTTSLVALYVIINLIVAAFGYQSKNGSLVATSVTSLACLAIAVASGLSNGYENLVVFSPYIMAGALLVRSIIRAEQQPA
jgi:hypothetical protein